MEEKRNSNAKEQFMKKAILIFYLLAGAMSLWLFVSSVVSPKMGAETVIFRIRLDYCVMFLLSVTGIVTHLATITFEKIGVSADADTKKLEKESCRAYCIISVLSFMSLVSCTLGVITGGMTKVELVNCFMLCLLSFVSVVEGKLRKKDKNSQNTETGLEEHSATK